MTVKSVVEMHGKRMVRSSWVNEQVHDNNIPSLESINLRDFLSFVSHWSKKSIEE